MCLEFSCRLGLFACLLLFSLFFWILFVTKYLFLRVEIFSDELKNLYCDKAVKDDLENSGT